MLAETRRKSKWSYNPQGKNNASAGVGRGLLEKMGWKDGQGLGSDGQGIVDPITLKYKNDSKGVGFKGNPDAVLAHQDDFEALLQGLSNQHASSSKPSSAKTSDVDSPDESGDKKAKKKKKTGEEKNRMRYHKSRRAKDTNNYSAVDIECIVGKAKARQEEAAKAATEAAEAEDEARPSFNQENGAEDSDGGNKKKEGSFLTINKGSADDYFKQKMAERMAKLGKPMNLEVKKSDCEEDEDLERPSFGGLGFGSSVGKVSDLAEVEERPGFGRPAFGASENSSAESNEGDGDEEKEAKPSFGLKFETAGTVQDYFATKMAALKAKRAAQLTGAEAQDETVAPQTDAQAVSDNKKVKKSKKKDKAENIVAEEVTSVPEKLSKKSKRKKDGAENNDSIADQKLTNGKCDEAKEKTPGDEGKSSKKSKKDKKSKKESEIDSSAIANCDSKLESNAVGESEKKSKKKSKKSTAIADTKPTDEGSADTALEAAEEPVKKSKKKKKNKKAKAENSDTENINTKNTVTVSPCLDATASDKADPRSKKSKKKKNKEEKDLSKMQTDVDETNCKEPEVNRDEKVSKKSQKIKEKNVEQEVSTVEQSESKDDSKSEKKKKRKRKSTNAESEQAGDTSEESAKLRKIEEELTGFKGTNLLTLKGYGRW